MRRLTREREGNVSAAMALLLVPLVGVMGLAAEGGGLFLIQRAAQNAADSAVIAAATNGCDPAAACHTSAMMPTYASEAQSVTAELGFDNGQNDVVVTPSNTAVCPDGSACYSVQVDKKVGLGLTRIVGFSGDTALGSGQAAQTVRAIAMAKRFPGTGFCVTALGSSPTAFEIKGVPNFDLTGCDLYVPNGGASCNNDSGDTIRYTYSAVPMASNKPCGTPTPDASAGEDYALLASNIPSASSDCPAGYPTAPASGPNKDVAPTQISGSISASRSYCGDVQLSGNVTVTADTVLTFQNGRLDLNGYTLTTTNGAHLTLVMGGTSGSYNHTIVSTRTGGVLDYSAPTGGTWSGVAFYQKPDLTQGVDMTYSGNNPAFQITGLIYAPNAHIDISGAINHASGGDACLAFIVETIQVVGTGSLFAKPTRECDRAGLDGLGQVYDLVKLVM